MMDKETYEQALKARQKAHLDGIKINQNIQFQPCAHDSCPECCGTGIKKDGTMCIHNLYCGCPKCSPRFM